jgi:hypothetical protein
LPGSRERCPLLMADTDPRYRPQAVAPHPQHSQRSRLALSPYCRSLRTGLHRTKLLSASAPQRSSEVVNSWEAALRLIDRYPWHRLSPLTVHPEFCERVWVAVQERFGRDRRSTKDCQLERWREPCTPRLL